MNSFFLKTHPKTHILGHNQPAPLPAGRQHSSAHPRTYKHASYSCIYAKSVTTPPLACPLVSFSLRCRYWTTQEEWTIPACSLFQATEHRRWPDTTSASLLLAGPPLWFSSQSLGAFTGLLYWWRAISTSNQLVLIMISTVLSSPRPPRNISSPHTPSPDSDAESHKSPLVRRVPYVSLPHL